MIKVAIAGDHASPELKEFIKNHDFGVDVTWLDLGTNGSESVDFPDYAAKAANAVLSGEADLGVLICGTGIGISITANRFKGIRCALCTDTTMARLTREHNNANMLAVGARITGPETVRDIVKTFLTTEFDSSQEKYQRRNDKIDQVL